MDEALFARAADRAMAYVERVLADLDPDRLDLERPASGVLTLTFADKSKCVLNTQKPTRQLWLAYGATAWHFAQAEGSEAWRDVRQPDLELYDVLGQLVMDGAALAVTWPAS